MECGFSYCGLISKRVAALVNCCIVLAKLHKDRFTMTISKNGQQIREQIWKSQNKILDELKKAGALSSRKMLWPRQYGDKIVFKVKNPVSWYWNEL